MPRVSAQATPRRADPLLESSPLHWSQVWLVVTPIWALLVATRVLFYALERMRYPQIVPPVIADAAQGVLLWPPAALGCWLTLWAWKHAGSIAAITVALLTSALVGSVARPAYGLATWLTTSTRLSHLAEHFFNPLAGSAYPWISNAVEYSVLYLSGLAATLGFLGVRALIRERVLRRALEIQATQERLRALRAQINPHFLFNALNTLVTLNDVHSPGARHLLLQLSDLLRQTLRASDREEHELRDELRFAKAHLLIQQARQPARIVWEIRVDGPCHAVAVPTLILLPLIENAVKHGLRGDAGAVHIEIEAQRRADDLLVRVTNTCSASLPAADPHIQGFGLRSVRERLQVMFGERGELVVRRTQPAGFEALVQLPWHELRHTEHISGAVA